MAERIIEIEQDERHLSLDRGFLVVSSKEAETAKIPIDDLLGIVIHAYSTSLTHHLIAELMNHNVAVVFCDRKHQPAGMIWPLSRNYRQARRFQAQIESTKPLSKKLWQQIVKNKILNQAFILRCLNHPFEGMENLAESVRSGDPENVEAHAAMRYWPLMFGKEFRRNDESQVLNSFLNYGYAILRTAVARFVAGAGLHPSIGIHHEHPHNTMPLVDDLMEPFRPFVDLTASRLKEKNCQILDRESKKILAGVLKMELETETERTTLTRLVERASLSLAQTYEGNRNELDLPKILGIASQD